MTKSGFSVSPQVKSSFSWWCPTIRKQPCDACAWRHHRCRAKIASRSFFRHAVSCVTNIVMSASVPRACAYVRVCDVILPLSWHFLFFGRQLSSWRLFTANIRSHIFRMHRQSDRSVHFVVVFIEHIILLTCKTLSSDEHCASTTSLCRFRICSCMICWSVIVSMRRKLGWNQSISIWRGHW